jgi:GalNAc-alpha-(1->4)-GalNAc-alpha-(1->3)-diNAcBac-PP-undecaprenol alpha-1,4-N-acetyl-D-galactosaminyltransferase
MRTAPVTEERLRVVFVIGHLGYGGAQRVLSRMAHRLAADCDITVVTFADGDEPFKLPADVSRLRLGGRSVRHGIPLAGTLNNITRLLRLRRALRTMRAHCALSFIGPTNVLLILASLGLPIRVVVSERNDPSSQSFGPIWDFLTRSCYRWADLVTANSKVGLRALAEYVPKEKLAFLPNPVPAGTENYRPSPLILSVGRLAPQKRHDRVLRAFASISPNHAQWRLALVGDGPDRKSLSELIEVLGVGDRVEMPGFVDPAPYFGRASIFLLLSLYEGTSNALLEAMATGITPVVASEAGDAESIVTHGANGLVVSGNDATETAEALSRLIDDPVTLERLGKAAKQSVEAGGNTQVTKKWLEALGVPQARF